MMAKVRHVLAVVFAIHAVCSATPQFARKHNAQCAMCHSAVPKLNQTGENFLANSYRLPPESQNNVSRTLPLAVWASMRGFVDQTNDRARALPNRVEIISAGPIAGSSAFYFLEWLPVSQDINANNSRQPRHGRFEDLFLTVPVGPLQFTVGQFRALTQVDVSRRLSISEPLAFSTGIAGRTALSGRLASLRSFSLSGRAPGFRLAHHLGHSGGETADGWYNSLTVPLSGEFVIPLTDRVRRQRNFEFELRPKGVLLESHYRHRLSTVGVHAFIGDERRLIGGIGAFNYRQLHSTFAAGVARTMAGITEERFSWENEWIPTKHVALGFRIDDRTGTNRPAAYIPHANVYFPLTTYTLRFALEQRLERGNKHLLLETSLIF